MDCRGLHKDSLLQVRLQESAHTHTLLTFSMQPEPFRDFNLGAQNRAPRLESREGGGGRRTAGEGGEEGGRQSERGKSARVVVQIVMAAAAFVCSDSDAQQRPQVQTP